MEMLLLKMADVEDPLVEGRCSWAWRGPVSWHQMPVGAANLSIRAAERHQDGANTIHWDKINLLPFFFHTLSLCLDFDGDVLKK